MESRILISKKDAAEKLAVLVDGKVWDKKPGEVRVYAFSGYLRVAVETTEKAQIQYFLKSYDIPKVKEAVKAFNELYEITDSKVPVLMQEDEDGIIAPAGQHESGVQIVREWLE